MSKITWNFVTKLTDKNCINAFEQKYKFSLPNDLQECIKKNNGGVPEPYTLLIEINNEKVFGGLLSFNVLDSENVYKIIDILDLFDGNHLKFLPFGIDPFGNYFCLNNNKIYFYNHETENSIYICDTFTEFLAKLK